MANFPRFSGWHFLAFTASINFSAKRWTSIVHISSSEFILTFKWNFFWHRLYLSWHTLGRFLSLSFLHQNTHTHTFSLSHTHSFSFPLSCSLAQTLSVSLTDTPILSLSLSLSLFRMLAPSLTHTHFLSLFHARTCAYTHTHSTSIPLCYGRCPFSCSLAYSFFNIFFSCHHKRTLSLSLTHINFLTLQLPFCAKRAFSFLFLFLLVSITLTFILSLSLSLSLYPTQTFSMYFSISLFP